MILAMAGADQTTPIVKTTITKNKHSLELLDDQLKANKYIAGPELTAADIMLVFTLTTMRQFQPMDLGKYANVLRWLGECAARPAYRKAMRKGDAGTVEVEAGVSGKGPESFPPMVEMHRAQGEAKAKV